MGIISKSIGISKTIRNANRLREIVTILAKHGFGEFMNLGILSALPGETQLPQSDIDLSKEFKSEKNKDWPKLIGNRLRLSFEELGPTFVKIGQLISTREDFFDSSFIDEMKLLRDKVRPIPFDQAKEVIERSLGRPVSDIFLSLGPDPIGMASIGVVYPAKLLNNVDVVVKVKRPNIEKAIRTDFSLFLFIIGQIEKASQEIRFLGLSRLLKDFEATLNNELNFNIEANNCEKLRKNMAAHKDSSIFYIPQIYREYTREDVIVMERLFGTPFSVPEKLNIDKEELKEKLIQGIQVFIKTFLQDGLFHADLHGGNFFLLPNKDIGIIDFGLVGTLSKKGRQNFIAIIYALITSNFEDLIYEFLDVAEYENIPNVEALTHDVRDVLSPFIGLTVQQTNFALVLQSITNTLTKHQIYLPREWFIVFRAFITLDGVGRSLGIDFDIFSIFEKDIHELIKGTLDKEQMAEEAAWILRDILPITRTFPRHLRWYLREWAKRNYTFEIRHSGHEESIDKINAAITFLGFSLLASVFFLSGVLILPETTISNWRDIQSLTWIFWAIGLAIMIRGTSLLKK